MPTDPTLVLDRSGPLLNGHCLFCTLDCSSFGLQWPIWPNPKTKRTKRNETKQHPTKTQTTKRREKERERQGGQRQERQERETGAKDTHVQVKRNSCSHRKHVCFVSCMRPKYAIKGVQAGPQVIYIQKVKENPFTTA
jgi:hypothetical protein